MKNCPNCGLEMNDKARFCSLCGFEFTNQRVQNPFDGQQANEQINRQAQNFDPAEQTQTFSATDDTIYFNTPNQQDMNGTVSPHSNSYGRSEDTSARPPVRHNADNGNMRSQGQPYNNGIQSQPFANTGGFRAQGQPYGNNENRTPDDPYSNNGFDNYGYDEEQPQTQQGIGIETDKPGRNNALIILSAAAVFAAIVLVVVIFALASRGKKNDNDGEVSKVTKQIETEAVTEAPEETEEETEKPTEKKKETEKKEEATKERVKAEKIAERKCYIDSDSDELYSYKSEYVLNDMDKKTETELWNGMELSARSTCHSHKKNWYECWRLDTGDYVGWVDEKLLTFGEIPHEEETEAPVQNDPVSIDGNNILHVDFDIAGYDYWSIQDYLGMQLGDQIDFPFWGINDLKYAVGDYHGNKLCFVFKYDKLVSVVYETKGTINQDILNNASSVYGGYNTIEEGRRYGFNANRGCLYIIEQDNMGYNTDGQNQDVVHQKVMLSELYQDNNNQQQQQNQQNQWGQDWGQFWNW